MSDYPPDTTLAEVLRQSGHVLTDPLNPEHVPMLVFMRRKLTGADELEKTTLKDLGLTSGRAIGRFSYNAPDSVGQTQAMSVDVKMPERPREPSPEHRPMR